MNTIKGENIHLRAIEPHDVETLYKWENNTSVWKVSYTIAPISKFVLEEYIAHSHNDIYTNKQLRLMIDLNESNKSIGTIDIFDFEPLHRRAGIGILIAEQSERRKGYAFEAIELIIKYTSNILNLHQIYCNIISNNEASLNLFCKLGFKIQGTKKDWVFYENKWYDEYFLQLIF
jgi:diamine N-acetyltransferase